ncbi:MAG: FHA domain-containing protein [Planctomycetaceae bacterium]
MKVTLRVEKGEASRKSFAVSRNTLIGRSNSCDLRIESDDVQSEHCFLLVTDNGVWVRDLSSSNGTQVEGSNLATGEDCLLNPGSHLKVGPVEFSVHFELGREPAMARLGSRTSKQQTSSHRKVMTQSCLTTKLPALVPAPNRTIQ